MSECESTRGEWSVPGQPPNRCPDCGAAMPLNKGALRSDHAMANHDQSKVSQVAVDGNPVMRRHGRGIKVRWAA